VWTDEITTAGRQDLILALPCVKDEFASVYNTIVGIDGTVKLAEPAIKNAFASGGGDSGDSDNGSFEALRKTLRNYGAVKSALTLDGHSEAVKMDDDTFSILNIAMKSICDTGDVDGCSSADGETAATPPTNDSQADTTPSIADGCGLGAWSESSWNDNGSFRSYNSFEYYDKWEVFGGSVQMPTGVSMWTGYANDLYEYTCTRGRQTQSDTWTGGFYNEYDLCCTKTGNRKAWGTWRSQSAVGPCSRACGGGSAQVSTGICYAPLGDVQLDSSKCDPSTNPNRYAACNTAPCATSHCVYGSAQLCCEGNIDQNEGTPSGYLPDWGTGYWGNTDSTYPGISIYHWATWASDGSGGSFYAPDGNTYSCNVGVSAGTYWGWDEGDMSLKQICCRMTGSTLKKWGATTWSSCSAVICGEGTQTRDVYCAAFDESVSYEDTMCDTLPKPPSIQGCSMQACGTQICTSQASLTSWTSQEFCVMDVGTVTRRTFGGYAGMYFEGTGQLYPNIWDTPADWTAGGTWNGYQVWCDLTPEHGVLIDYGIGWQLYRVPLCKRQ
jgi:hypothetical protein